MPRNNECNRPGSFAPYYRVERRGRSQPGIRRYRRLTVTRKKRATISETNYVNHCYSCRKVKVSSLSAFAKTTYTAERMKAILRTILVLAFKGASKNTGDHPAPPQEGNLDVFAAQKRVFILRHGIKVIFFASFAHSLRSLRLRIFTAKDAEPCKISRAQRTQRKMSGYCRAMVYKGFYATLSSQAS